MTAQEHRLMKMMFGIHFGILAEILKVLSENGTLKTGDEAQLWNIASQTAGKREVFLAVADMYAKAAVSCGVNIES